MICYPCLNAGRGKIELVRTDGGSLYCPRCGKYLFTPKQYLDYNHRCPICHYPMVRSGRSLTCKNEGTGMHKVIEAQHETQRRTS